MCKPKSLALLFAMLLGWGAANSQTPCEVSVHVIDEHRHVLTGAHVHVNSQHKSTGVHGRTVFTLPCADSATIEVSFVGFSKQRFTILPLAKKDITITLESSVAHIHQVVVEEHRSADHNTAPHAELSEENLRNNSRVTLAKSLEQVSGVQSIQTGVGIAKPMIRGMSGSRVVFNDAGVRQEGQQWGLDHGLEKDQFGIEHVEVIKGPATLRYGSGAIAGVVNVLPATVPGKNSAEGDVHTTYRSNNNHIGVSGGAKVNKNNWFLNMRLSAIDFGDIAVPADSFVYNRYQLPLYNGRLKNTAGRERNYALDGGIMHKKGVSRVMYSSYNLDAGMFAGALGTPRSYQLEPDGEERSIDLPMQRVRHEKMTSHNTWYAGKRQHKIQLVAGYQMNRRLERSFPHTHGANAITAGDSALFLELNTASLNAFAEHSLCSRFKGEIGLDIMHRDNKAAGFEFLIPNYQSFTYAAFYVVNGDLSRKTTVQGGLRLGGFNIRGERSVRMGTADATNGVAVRSPAFSKSFFNWSASLGMRYNLNNHHAIKTQFNKSFRNPNIAEFASNGIHHGTFRHEQGDTSLAQEEGYQLDIAWIFEKSRWKQQLNAYASWFQNYIYLNPSARFSPLPEGGQLFQYTQHDALFTGIEYDVKWSITDQLSWTNTADYVFTYNINTTLPLPFSPPGRWRTQFIYTIEPKSRHVEKVEPFISYLAVSPQQRVDRNEATTPGYGLLNGGVRIHIPVKKGELQGSIDVQNALNTPYLNHISRYRWLNLPEQGRNIVVGLFWKW